MLWPNILLTWQLQPLLFSLILSMTPIAREQILFVGTHLACVVGVACALSCGLWLNLADLDAPTQALKPEQRNSRYVDAVMTIPSRAMMPLSGINIAFDREAVGPALLPALKLAGEGNLRWETMEDIWSGMCVKVVCDHLGLGVKKRAAVCVEKRERLCGRELEKRVGRGEADGGNRPVLSAS
ncbi:hypothetical protein OIU77_006192 [Salix suchowensis]|uniref:Uncharacterized protein n=1 Tax=Salix suchowensis TaxID=1278906 RepID=A0ABQ9AJX4_9ROSI|nr:hypothetical protein OIU77_006192 [Salix suchowensis]